MGQIRIIVVAPAAVGRGRIPYLLLREFNGYRELPKLWLIVHSNPPGLRSKRVFPPAPAKLNLLPPFTASLPEPDGCDAQKNRKRR